jgi:hypothetical protein
MQTKTNFKKKFLLPPKRQILRNPKKMIMPYSKIKIKEKTPPEYSTLKPETNSDSPSEKSKGVRLLSAMHTNNQQKNKTNK